AELVLAHLDPRRVAQPAAVEQRKPQRQAHAGMERDRPVYMQEAVQQAEDMPVVAALQRAALADEIRGQASFEGGKGVFAAGVHAVVQCGAVERRGSEAPDARGSRLDMTAISRRLCQSAMTMVCIIAQSLTAR